MIPLDDIMSDGPSAIEIEAALVAQDMAEFVRRTWPIIEPGTPLAWNWHIDVICEHLQAVTNGDIQDLIINIPPGFMKSILVSVMWPAWEWLTDPAKRKIFASNSGDLALRDSVRTRQIVEDPLYQSWVDALHGLDRPANPLGWRMARDQNAKSLFQNEHSGFRQCVTVGGKVTGKRGDDLVCDDPHDVDEVIKGDPDRIAERMEETEFWWDKKMKSRLNDQRVGARVLVMQRLHPKDLAGCFMKQPGVVVLCLPMEYDPEHPNAYPYDPRTEPGELLFPEMFPASVVEKLKASLKEQYAGQYNQRPTAKEGGLFKRVFITKRYKKSPEEMAAECDEVGIFLDCAFKKRKGSDPVGFLVWGRKGPLRILLDRVNENMGIVGTRQTLKDLAAKWPQADLKLIEDKANGPAVIEEVGEELEGVVAFNPDLHGDKWARAHVASIYWEAGNFLLPDPDATGLTWVSDYITQMCTFPNAAHDEDVDCTSMMIIRWRGHFAYRVATGPNDADMLKPDPTLDDPQTDADPTAAPVWEQVRSLLY